MRKCFFDGRKNCIVHQRMIKLKNEKGLLGGVIDKPLPAWCPSCLLWQLIQLLKEPILSEEGK